MDVNDPDPIIARITAEPDVREVSFPGESDQRNFHLEDGPRRLEVHYGPPVRLVCVGTARFPKFMTDQMTGDRAKLLETLESALAWLHGREAKAATWRDRPGML